MILKPASAELDYPIIYELTGSETIDASSWSIWPNEIGGLAVKASSDAIDGGIVSCIVTGGVVGHLYELTNSIETSEGRKDAQTITFRIGVVEAVR